MNYSIDIEKLRAGDFRTLAKAITLVENDRNAGNEFLKTLPFDTNTPLIGITGPPGAGKSSLVNALVHSYLKEGKRIGIIAVDPTSPFNYGSLLGDRIRMSEHFNHPSVYIRSLASRGSLGGLSARIFEISDVMKHAGFDLILVETVGVGQSEVEIAGLADTTVVVLVPEAGDEVQTLKSGLMEIADIFVVNKSDREGAAAFEKNLRAMVHGRMDKRNEIEVIQTIATTGSGMNELRKAINTLNTENSKQEKRLQLMTLKAYHLIQEQRMSDINKHELEMNILKAAGVKGFNMYQFITDNYKIK